MALIQLLKILHSVFFKNWGWYQDVFVKLDDICGLNNCQKQPSKMWDPLNKDFNRFDEAKRHCGWILKSYGIDCCSFFSTVFLLKSLHTLHKSVKWMMPPFRHIQKVLCSQSGINQVWYEQRHNDISSANLGLYLSQILNIVSMEGSRDKCSGLSWSKHDTISTNGSSYEHTSSVCIWEKGIPPAESLIKLLRQDAS